jgi:hypothetical protein
MKYYGLRIYDLEESIIASSLPMLKKKYTPQEFEEEVINLKGVTQLYGKDKIIEYSTLSKEELGRHPESVAKAIKHFKRVVNLGNAKPSSGHDCATKGIMIAVNIEADQSFWLQWERYHHQDTVSSMSTMHCLTKFDLYDGLFSEWTDKRQIDILNEKIVEYNGNPTQDNFHKVIHNCPEGIELCRRVDSNYLQFKTMHSQREFHKMYSWSKDFMKLCDELPYFKELCLKKAE